MPKAHQAQAQYSLNFIMDNAKKIGMKTTELVEKMLASRAFPQQAYRACYGLLRLENRYNAIRLENACAKRISQSEIIKAIPGAMVTKSI